MRCNLLLGINDLVFVVLTDVVLGTLSLAYTQLPTLVLFAKITPKNIEGTFFAFLTGTLNFTNGVLSPLVGTKINDMFVGVNSEDQSNFYILMIISMATSFIPFTFLWLVPLKDQIKELQEERERAISGANDGEKNEKSEIDKKIQ